MYITETGENTQRQKTKNLKLGIDIFVRCDSILISTKETERMVDVKVGAFGDGLMMGLLEDAAVSGANAGVRTNFGKLTFGAMEFTEWVDNQPTPVLQDRYEKLDERGRSMNIVINIDIQEFNPDLDFTYGRSVRVNSPDWFAHWQAGIIETFGLADLVEDGLTTKEAKVAVGKLVAQKMYELDGMYVEMLDAEQEPKKNQTPEDKKYYTPELVRVFPDGNACVAEYNKRFGRTVSFEAGFGGGAEAVPDAPDGFESFAEFSESVAMLREEGETSKSIAEQLGVKLTLVLKV